MPGAPAVRRGGSAQAGSIPPPCRLATPQAGQRLTPGPNTYQCVDDVEAPAPVAATTAVTVAACITAPAPSAVAAAGARRAIAAALFGGLRSIEAFCEGGGVEWLRAADCKRPCTPWGAWQLTGSASARQIDLGGLRKHPQEEPPRAARGTAARELLPRSGCLVISKEAACILDLHAVPDLI